MNQDKKTAAGGGPAAAGDNAFQRVRLSIDQYTSLPGFCQPVRVLVACWLLDLASHELGKAWRHLDAEAADRAADLCEQAGQVLGVTP